MGKFCKNCGSPMKENEKFCAKCGTRSDIVRPAASVPVRHPVPAVMTGSKTAKKEYKIAVSIAGIVMIISTVLPYLEMMGETINLLRIDGTEVGDGLIFIILSVLCMILVYLDKKIPAVVISVIPCIMCCYEIYQLNSVYEELAGLSGIVSKKIGFYLIIISSAALLLLCVMNYMCTTERRAG